MTLLEADEQKFLSHMTRWGSDAIRKLGTGRWIWDEFYGIKGARVVYKTKRAAGEAVERYIDGLINRKAGRA